MSAAKHTPGPWTVFETSFYLQVSDEKKQLIADIGHAPEYLGRGAQMRRKDDARLIAAAPELLEALQLFVAWSKEELNHTPGIGFWDRVEMFRELDEKAAEAIAKATGGQA